MSSVWTDEEVELVASLLSDPRLASFVKIAGTRRRAIDLHYQTILLAAALMPVTGIVEVVLRNAVAEQLRSIFEDKHNPRDWLNDPPNPFEWKMTERKALKDADRSARRAAYAKLNSVEKRILDSAAYPGGIPTALSHRAQVKARQALIPISRSDQIAQLTLHFWKRLFSSDYESTLWKRSLRKLFPNKSISRAQVADELEIIYQARNRIAHQEPVVGPRCARTIEAIDFVALNFKTKAPGEMGILARMTIDCRATLKKQAADFDALSAQLKARPSFP